MKIREYPLFSVQFPARKVTISVFTSAILDSIAIKPRFYVMVNFIGIEVLCNATSFEELEIAVNIH